jgi:hypothetical protein
MNRIFVIKSNLGGRSVRIRFLFPLLALVALLFMSQADARPFARFASNHPRLAAALHPFRLLAPRRDLAAPGPQPYHGGNWGNHGGGWGQYIQPFFQNFVQPQPQPTIYPWPVINPATGGMWGYTPYVLHRLAMLNPLADFQICWRHHHWQPQPTPAPIPVPVPVPQPTPTPPTPVPPTPVPVPTPNGQITGLTFVFNYLTVTPAQAQLMQATAIKTYCALRSIKLRSLQAAQAVDKSTAPTDVARIQAAIAVGLPVCWLEGLEVGKPLPADVLGVTSLLVLPTKAAPSRSTCPAGGCPNCQPQPRSIFWRRN